MKKMKTILNTICKTYLGDYETQSWNENLTSCELWHNLMWISSGSWTLSWSEEWYQSWYD